MELQDLANLIQSRRSIRKWQDRDVSEQQLVQAVELATWAPNAGNRQNWRFYVILNRSIIGEIADVVQAGTDEMASWPEARQFGDEVESWRQRATFFREAPAAIAVATRRYQSLADWLLAAREEHDPQARKMREGRNMANSAIQSVGSAVSQLLLILHQMGLGAVWMTGPTQAKEQIEKIIHVPPDMDLVTYIPVGYPAEQGRPATRLPVKEVCEVVR